MGGARAGEVASSLAAAALQAGEVDGNGKDRVIALIQAANRSVYERSSQDAEVAGMGTTMTVALVEDAGVTFGHVGDSRAYVLRDGELEQLTDDHSLVAELVRGGKLSAEEAEHHPQRSVITRALGTDPDVDVDTFTVDAEDGDVFVLCSDGLTDMVGDDEIGEVLASRAREPRGSGGGARPPREQGGRPGQHHRRRLRDDGRAGRADARADRRADAADAGGGRDAGARAEEARRLAQVPAAPDPAPRRSPPRQSPSGSSSR